MRTTVDIDDDILHVAKDRARREHRSTGAVLSELARQALTRPAERGSARRFGFRPLPSRGEAVTNAMIDDIAEAAE